MKHTLALLFYTCLYLCTVPYTLAHTYYISPNGNDANPGTSAASAWRSIAKANNHRYSPGDTLLLQGGYTFAGGLYFHTGNMPGKGAPLVVSSYGEGCATLLADTSYGVYAHNVAGIEIRRLNLKGSGPDTNRDHGILFYNDLPGNVKLAHVVVDEVEVTGFRKSGITIGAWSGNSGYEDVRITRALVHDIGSEGINTWGEFDQNKKGYAHSNVYIGYCHVYQVYGLPLPDKHSGSGIVLSDVDGGVIEHSVVHSSGTGNTHCGGPVGIWAWDANNVTIQYNEAYHMSAGSGCDGGGFDLDGGVTNSIMQYNYSHDNDGAGFLIAQFEWARPMHNNVIRYNISENDGRKNDYKGITLWVADEHHNGGNRDLLVYNNTVFADQGIAPSGGGVFLKSGRHYNVQFFNNIFYTRKGAPLVVAADTAELDVRFQHNAWFSEDGPSHFVWKRQRYTSWQEFQAATCQFTGSPAGIATDPQLAAPGTAGTMGYPPALQQLAARYSLRKKSPLIARGIAVPLPHPFTAATQDIVGNRLAPGSTPDLGAVAFSKPKRFNWLRKLF